MKSSHGGRRPGAGKPKGVKWPSTLAKAEARELTRKFVTRHMVPMLQAQVAKAIGTYKLMLRKPDGTWRAVTEDDDIEKALNGDPNMFWIAPTPPDTASFTALAGYALDKPTEHIEAKVTSSIADLSDEELKAKARQLLGVVSGH